MKNYSTPNNLSLHKTPDFMKIILLIILLLAVIMPKVKAQIFTPGNIAVMVSPDGSNANTTASVYEFLPSTSSQVSAVNTYSINGTSGGNAMRFQGSTAGSLYLSNSNDGTLLCFSGYNTTTGASNDNTILPRAVGTLNNSYTFNLAATYTGTSGKNQRGATTINNTAFYFADQSGLYTNSATSVTNATNLLCVKSFGGTVYATSATQVGTFSSPTATTFTNLTNLSAAAITDFYLVSSGLNGATYDIAYIINGTSASAGTIYKFSLVSGTWTANGSYTTNFGGSRLAAQVGGGGAYLYAVSGIGSTIANSLIRLTDAAGFNSTINITTANNVTLYTASGNVILKGVAFAPCSSAPTSVSASGNSSICSGSTLNLIGLATGAISYSWTGPNSFSSSLQNPSISNATTAATGTYTLTTTNGCGSTTATTAVTVNSSVTPSVSIAASTSNTICTGNNVTFTATPTNGGNTFYAWTKNGSAVGSNSASYSDAGLADNDAVICTITSDATCASPTTASSNTVTMTVTGSVTPSVSISANTSNTICSGTSVTFTATPINGGVSPSYQWTLNGGNVGINSATYSNSTLTNSDVVSCILTSSNSCASPLTANANNITISILSVPAKPGNFTTRLNTFVYQGQSAAAYTVPNVSGATYNWSFNGTGATINGTGNSVTIDYSMSATTGTLTVTANNICGTSIARSALVAVNSAITIPSTNLDYSFVTLGCNRVDYLDTTFSTGDPNFACGKSTANVYQLNRVFTEISHLSPLPKYLVMTGDIVMGYKTPSTADTTELTKQLKAWKAIYESHPLSSMGITLIAIPGNHETQDKAAGKKSFASAEQIFTRVMAPYIHGSNGPGIGGPDGLTTDQSKLTYSFNYGSDHFIIINTDPVGKDGITSYKWIANDIQTARANNARHIFAFGHKPAYSSSLAPAGGLDAAATLSQRDSLWKYLEDNKCEAMFSAHEHLWDTINPHHGKTYQVINGNGGTRVETTWVGAGQKYYGYTLVNLYTNNAVNVMGLGRNTDMSATVGTSYPANEDKYATTVRKNFNICLTSTSTVTTTACINYVWNATTYTATGTYTYKTTNAAGCDSTTTLNLTITPSVTPSLSILANTSTICSGTNVTFTATATNGGTPLYQWTKNGSNVGTNSATYTNSSFANNDVVACIMTSSATCLTTNTASSNTVTITVNPVAAQPGAFTTSSANVSAGQSGVIYTVPNDATVTYAWTYSGTGATINGSGNSVSVNFSSSATSGTLSVTTTNGCGSGAATSMNIAIISNNFTAGRIVILQTIGSTSKASSAITLKEITANGEPGMSVTLPTTGTNPIQTAGVYGGSEGFLTTSTDGKNLVLGGYGTSSVFADITGTNASAVPRVVGNVSPSGAYTQIASNSTFFSLNDIRGAISDGTNFWASGGSSANIDGIDYFGLSTPVGLGTSATPPKAYAIRIFNGQIYYSTQKAGPTNSVSQLGIFSFGSGLPTSGTPAPIQVINTGSTVVEDFSINPTTDVCYIAVNLNTAAGGIQKWTKSGATWTLAYTLGTGASNVGAYGLVVDYSAANPIIYATTFESAGNRVIKITDTGSGSTATTLVAASAGVFNKGITFAPVDSGTPTVNLSVSTNSASEAGVTAVTITATTSTSVSSDQTVTLTVSGTGITVGDYTLSNTTITIPNGTHSGTATFTVINDAAAEGSETATLTISNPSPGIILGSNITQNILITDNDNFPPTIVINVASTSNFIDGGIVISPASPYGLSGVIGDPTDPAKTLGIDFTISDVETTVSTLTVTAVSSNTLVVTNANLNITGTGSSRNVKITPSGVGYSTITVSVNDGINNTTYILSYAASDPSPSINPTNTFWHTGMSDGSDGIPLDDDYYISGDDELDIINVYSRSASGLPLVSYDYASHLNLPDPSKPEADIEASARSTTHTNRVYFTGSMSNGKLPYDNKPNRDRLFATIVTGTGANTAFAFAGYVNIRTPLLAWGDAHGYNFTASAAAGVNSKATAGFSIEGMAFGPDSTTLFLGLRAPLVPMTSRTKAVIVPLTNFETWFNNGAPSGNPTFGAPIELEMDGRGIRDIIRLSNGTYVIVAGSPVDDGGVNGLYKWSGNAADAPILVNNTAVGILNMEGLMEVKTGGQLSLSNLQVISDGGSMIPYQDNFESKDFGDLKLRKFRSDILTDLDLALCSNYSVTVNAGGNTTFNVPNSVILTAFPASNSYLWSTGATTQSITVHTSGSYSVAVANSSNCSATSLVTVVTAHSLPSDVNLDGITDLTDFLSVLGKYNFFCTCPEDMNKDGKVDVTDFLMLLGQFNQSYH